jgi:hypothetical protein
MPVIRVQVTGKGVQQDVLFPSQELVYGSLVEADKETLELMEAVGIKFADDIDVVGVRLGTIDALVAKSVDLSRLLSSGKQRFPIYVIDREDRFCGLWQYGVWFDDQNAELGHIGQYLERVVMTPLPICLA